ncbi:gliding motility-associated C-terminal domain-containing protein [uncultured Flavobacterium sp.]|uniref:gliding motility-associated C-terminal domain-containing protein n=1 Tax=uncultured Flavobacterium sp. TaxID=165435 RepID=UPI0025F62FB5|nr:gliding motility-associated C-terminal domain-containing protein [uncultured Flavobacterium sp.]
MKKQLLVKLFLLFSLLSGSGAIAQLDPFSLTVTPTPQTCLGNGALSFSVSGTAPGATMGYQVYLLPNTTTPVATVSTNSVTSLVAGSYLVIATQSVGGQSNTAQANATIVNQVQTLTYEVVTGNVRCPGDGTFTINVLTGTAATYQLVSGPVTTAPQSGNQFGGLDAGTYEVRVADDCNNAVVTTVQLTQVPTNVLMDPPAFPAVELPTCNTMTVDHFFATIAGHEIFFPLTFEYTVFPPGGGTPTIVTQVVATGNNVENHLISVIPFYHDQEYSYNLKVTDVCGNVFTRNNNIIDRKFNFTALPQTESCGNYYFEIAPTVYKSPYTVTFLDAPDGFNPVAFNPAHPSHSGEKAAYGSDSNPVPHGIYQIQVTDFCGHTEIKDLEIIDIAEPTVISSVVGETCLGQIGISITNREIASVVITVAPQDYIDQQPGGLPDDVSEFIVPVVGFVQGNLPMGTYTFVVTDECGDEYEITETIQPSPEDLMLMDTQRAGCALGEGSVRLGASVNKLVSATITAGPPGFAVPADVSTNIAPGDGNLYMNSLPAGTYTFETVDNCGTARTKTVTIQGYQIVNNTVNVVANCNSFNIQLQHTSNGSNLQSFWLQEYNEGTGQWGHPGTGAAYPANTLPNSTNSVLLSATLPNVNLAYTGTFRVIKAFHVFNNGAPGNFRCLQEIYEFDFQGVPVIEGAYSFPCGNNTAEVIIDATGVAPLSYAITTKNDQPFVVDNGTSNLFSGLEPATYNFMVTDHCNNSVNVQLDINALDPIEILAEGFCEGQDSSLSVQNFSFLDYAWYKDGAPGTILSTSNVLDFPGFEASEAGLYHVTISSDNPGSCINQTLDYTITPNALPNAGNNSTTALCNTGTSLDLASYLSNPHDAGGNWADADSSGALTGSVFNTTGIAQGTYNFTYTVTSACGVEDVAIITVQLKDTPAAPVIAPVAPACEGDDIQLGTNPIAGASYQWSGPNGFASADQNPVLLGATVAQSGNYTLVITVNGCISPASVVAVSVGETPDAGTDNNASLCNDGQAVNLADYLSATADPGGTWADTSASGGLAGNLFNTSGVAEGTYQFTYTVSGCGPDDAAIISVELKARPGAPVLAAVAPACEGADVQLSAIAVPGAAYAWTGPGGFASAEQNPLINAAGQAEAGTYSLEVTVNGCTSPASAVTVVIIPVPQFTMDGNAAICEGQSTEISVVPGNFNINDVSYTWYIDGIIQPDLTVSGIEVSEEGLYEVEVDNGSCTTMHELEVSLNTNAFDVALESGCLDFDYILSIVNVNDIPGASFEWTGPAGFSATTEAANITGLASGEYSVTVTNADGCSAEASVTVDNTNCFIPRGISPNDDQYNQSFDLTNLGVRDLMIFNRYGQKVYEKENYTNEWYGQSEKGELPTGTYFYVVTLSEGKRVTGWVYLQREVN